MDRCVSISCRLLVAILLAAAPASATQILVTPNGSAWELTLDPPSTTFHTTGAVVTNERVIPVPNTSVLLLLWDEQVAPDDPAPYYALSFDGLAVSRVHRTSYVLKLTAGAFDPLQGVPAVHPSLQVDANNELYIVQFFTQPLREFSDAVEALGGTVRGYLPDNARIIQMNDTTKTAVEALEYVRWVGPFHPAYRLEGYLRDNVDQAGQLFPLGPYDIMVFQRGLAQKTIVADHIASLAGAVYAPTSGGFGLQATLTPAQLLSVVHLNEVAFVNRWSPPTVFMDKARDVGHANFVEDEVHGGFTGQGVIGEVMDSYLQTSPFHQAFTRCSGNGSSCEADLDCPVGDTCQGTPILHGTTTTLYPGADGHGTWTMGTLFGDGTGIDPQLPEFGLAKGMIPDAQGIFADFCTLAINNNADEQYHCEEEHSVVNRHCHTCELVHGPAVCQLANNAPCPPPGDYQVQGPLNAVFQSNSWGGCGAGGCTFPAGYYLRTHQFDDLLFVYDIIACQAQGNSGYSGNSAPEAWAKNAVSVGGVYHHNTLQTTDDRWEDPGVNGRASIGPASDGRIKPDFTHFYDDLYTTDLNGAYWNAFGGTSGATPITCGHFGLFFQMWSEGIFGKDVDPAKTVFENRPHMSTAKAMMINTARQYDFVDDPNEDPVDKARVHQGWGLADVGKLYLLRNQFPVIDNEETILKVTESKSYPINVEANTYALKVTLVYTDPAADYLSDDDPTIPDPPPPQTLNDLNLKVTSPPPGSSEYWGNCGLRDGNWSTTCAKENPPDARAGIEDVMDTVENVFVQNPEVGDGPSRSAPT